MAATTASERRKQRQEELREKLKGGEYIRQLDDIDAMLTSGQVSRDELDVIKVRIDLNFRRLAKLLPDERFMEIEGRVTSHEARLEDLE